MGESVKRGVFRGSRPHVWLGSLNTNAAMPIIFPRFGSGSLPTFRHFFAVFRSRAACCLSGRVQTPSSSRASMSCRHSDRRVTCSAPCAHPNGALRPTMVTGRPSEELCNERAQKRASSTGLGVGVECASVPFLPPVRTRAITPTLAGMTIDGMSEIFFLLVSGLVVHPGCNAW